MNFLPIPLDALVGMYHPWRDFLGNLPFKNFILTDPVRQHYPWRELAISLLKDFRLPLWNPYSFAGTPLLANIQSAVFYPLNIFFFVLDFPLAWAIYIYSAWVLGFWFMFLYLRNLNLPRIASIFGSLCFILSGFFTAWFQNGVLTHTLIWLPLILYSIDKNKPLIFVLSLFFSFTAGHWQIFFYIFVLTHFYLILRRQITFLRFTLIFGLSSTPLLFVSTQFILLSARTIDQVWSTNPGWFIPWQNLIQFISPDFFGNPATLNYRGVFSYQEFIGYIGIAALICAFSAIIFIRCKIILFFGSVAFLGILLALPTPIAKIPFWLGIPFLSSSMPTRLLSVVDFSLAVLAAFGLTIISRKRGVFVILGITISLFWLFWPTKYLVVPTIMLVLTFLFRNYSYIVVLILLADLALFAYKFLPFTPYQYVYPETATIKFLQKHTQNYPWRFMTLEDEIFPPNTNIVYRLQSINGYDPLYLQSYQNLVGGGNRIIVPKNYKDEIINKLGVKYILTFRDISDKDYVLVFQEGKTKVFENRNVWPRAFFADARGFAEIVSYQENEVVIRTESLEGGNLVLSDAFYPLWKATVDGKEVEISVSDGFFRQVFVPSGRHIVRFFI